MSKAPDKADQPREQMNQAIGPEIDIPGPYPTGQAPTAAEAADSPTHEHGQAKVTRDAGSLGDLTREVSASTMAAETGGLGSPIYDEDKRDTNKR